MPGRYHGTVFLRVCLTLAVLMPAVAAAQPIYTWTDSDGVQHFTDEPRNVPRGVKATTTEGAHVNVVSSSAQAPAPAAKPMRAADAQAAAAQAQAAAAQAQAAAAQAQAAADARVQATLEDTWRQRFRDAREKVQVLEEEIEADRQRVEEVAGLPVSFGYTCAPGWGVPWPPAVHGRSGVAVSGQAGPGVNVSAGLGTTWSTGWVPPTYVTPCAFGFNPEFERTRDRLARNRTALVRAKEALADLERRAALEAVPLEWRR